MLAHAKEMKLSQAEINRLLALRPAHYAPLKVLLDSMTDAQLRDRVLQFADKVVLHHNGNVSAYGVMPNSDVVGWYLVGTAKELKRLYGQEGRKVWP
jgi:hypothetical protein